MNKPTFKERFSYWFDNRMSKGSIGLVKILLIFTLLVVLVFSAIIMLFGFNDGTDAAGVFWNSIATIINAWMPSYEEGSIGYLLIMALTAFAGLLVTSVLIGIFTSAIEERIVGLRRGNSPVIEEGHIVLIGFYPGEYTLLRQLMLAAEDDARTIVIGSEMERDELEQCIDENVEVPKNIRIVCRKIDPLDPHSIERLSIATCKTVIISPTEDEKTVKTLLAVSSLLDEYEDKKIKVNAITSREENRFPPRLASQHNMITLQSNDTMAKIIAHSCTQTGLSEVFREIFNFEGSELYMIKIKDQAGLTFAELLRRMDKGVPIGICRGEEMLMNPEGDLIVNEDDQILVYSQTRDSVSLMEEGEIISEGYTPERVRPEKNTHTLIFGNKSSLKVILKELPDNVQKATLVNYDKHNYEQIKNICAEREIELELIDINIRNEWELYQISKDAEHIIIQSNYGDEEEADMNTIFLLLNLRELREEYGLKYNITAEMRREKNYNLIAGNDHTDFVIATNMSSLFLAQLAESPGLIGAFREILSNEGNELYMKNAANLYCVGNYDTAQLRQILFLQGYIFLGRMTSSGEYVFNPPLHEEMEIRASDSLIVFGEN